MPHEEISKLLERIAQQFEGLMQKSSKYEENMSDFIHGKHISILQKKGKPM